MGSAETPFGLGPCHWTAFSLCSFSCTSSKEKVLDTMFLGRIRDRCIRQMQEKGGVPCSEFILAVYMILLNLFDPFVFRLLICKLWKIVIAPSSCGSYENKWHNLHNFLRTSTWTVIKLRRHGIHYYYCPGTSCSWFGWICTRRHLNKICPISVNPWSKWVSFSLY